MDGPNRPARRLEEAALPDSGAPVQRQKAARSARPKRLSSRFPNCIRVRHSILHTCSCFPAIASEQGRSRKPNSLPERVWTKSISVRESFLRDYPSPSGDSLPLKTPHSTVSHLPCSPLPPVYRPDLSAQPRDFEHDAATWSAPIISLGTWTLTARERSQPILSGNWRGPPSPTSYTTPTAAAPAGEFTSNEKKCHTTAAANSHPHHPRNPTAPAHPRPPNMMRAASRTPRMRSTTPPHSPRPALPTRTEMRRA